MKILGNNTSIVLLQFAHAKRNCISDFSTVLSVVFLSCCALSSQGHRTLQFFYHKKRIGSHLHFKIETHELMMEGM